MQFHNRETLIMKGGEIIMNIKKTLLTTGATVAFLGVSLTGSAFATYDGHYQHNENNYDRHDQKNGKYDNNSKNTKETKHYEKYAEAYKSDAYRYAVSKYHENNRQAIASNNMHHSNNWDNFNAWFSEKGYAWDHGRDMQKDWDDYNNWSHQNNKNWWDDHSVEQERANFESWHNHHYNEWEKNHPDDCHY